MRNQKEHVNYNKKLGRIITEVLFYGKNTKLLLFYGKQIFFSSKNLDLNTVLFEGSFQVSNFQDSFQEHSEELIISLKLNLKSTKIHICYLI